MTVAESRGIFHNSGKSFLVWVNEEDQMRIISMQPGDDDRGVPSVESRDRVGACVHFWFGCRLPGTFTLYVCWLCVPQHVWDALFALFSVPVVFRVGMITPATDVARLLSVSA